MKKQKTVIVIVSVVFIVLLLILLGWRYLKQEQENIQIDEYNFSKLNEIKDVLSSINQKDSKFNNISEFNEQFNKNITNIKNCYYLSNDNDFWINESENYIFAMSLHSQKYKSEYNKDYMIYPESMSVKIQSSLCSPKGGICNSDMLFQGILDIIFQPCVDKK